MLKKSKLIVYVTIMALMLQVVAFSPRVAFAADYTIGTDGNFSYKLVQDTGLNGYKLVIYNSSAVVWTSPSGPVGIRTIDVNNVISGFQYKAYSSVTVSGSDYICTASFTTANGSVINIEDIYTYSTGKINMERNSVVASVNSNDKGYMTTLAVRSEAANTPTYYKWFAPALWYGNDSDNFTDQCKTPYNPSVANKEASISVDNLSAAVIANYDTTSGLSLSIADTTKGKRETIDADINISNKNLIDDRINLPGLGLRNVTVGSSNYTEMFQTFPGYTSNWQGVAYNPNTSYLGGDTYRFSPVTLNSSKKSEIEISLKSYADFNTCFKTRWRDAYDNVTDDYRCDVKSAFDVLTAYIDRGYAMNGSRPQYMMNTNHPASSSGFLFRNVDLASIMLWAGNVYGNSQYLTRARAVINYDVSHNLLPNSFSRAYAEGLQNLLKAYIIDKDKNGVTNTSWYDYVISKVDANWISSSGAYYNDKFAIPLLIEVYNYTMDTKYLDRAKAIGEDKWNGGWNTLRFNWGVTDYGDAGGPAHDREMGGKALESFVGLYNATLDTKWLDRAKITADYLETWQIRQNLQMTPFSTSQYMTDQISMGNEVKPYGMSFVNSLSASADQYMVNWTPEFFKLYQATGDTHYKLFANDTLYNTLEWVNMNDRIGGMADSIHDSGIGFTFEVIWPSVDRERSWWNRGKGHIDNIPWVPYTIMTGIQQLKELTGYWGLDSTTYPTQIIKYEAEAAALSGGATVATDHTGSTGTAHVGGYTSQGATTTFTVNVPKTGKYRAVIRYGAGLGDRRNSLYVNGNKLGVLTFPNTVNWDTWGDRPVDLSLNAGNNTIAVKYDTGDNGYINLDNLIIIPIDQMYEAESEATLIGQSIVTTGSANYSGTGFVGWTETLGSAIRFTLNVPADGTYTLKTRYGAGNGNKTMSLYLNGMKYKQVTFPTTGDWSAWLDETETIPLRSGFNMIEYRYDSGDTGNINLDYIVISPNSKRLEAEYDAAHGGSTGKSYTNMGYSGGAYISMSAVQGGIVSFNVKTSAARSQKLSLRYSAGGGNTTASLYVDGTKLKQISLNSTGSWPVWAVREDTISLTAGFHTVDYKIDSGDGGNISVDCLEVSDGYTSDNIALNKIVTQSSMAYSGEASRAVDGNNDGIYNDGSVTHTNSEAGAWWMVDLGATYNVGDIKIFNRTGECMDRLSDYNVYVLDSSQTQVWSNHQTSYPDPVTTVNAAGASGRYVKIQLTGTNYLSLAEVQVFRQNIAQGKTATQSSTAYNGSASRAVDGNTDGAYTSNSTTHTNSEAGTWWKVDLGANYSINNIKVFGRDYECSDRLNDYYVYILDSNQNVVWSNHQTSYPNPMTAVTVGGTSGRYVKIQLTGTNVLSLAEVQVY